MSKLAQQTHQIIHEMAGELPALVGADAWPILDAELIKLDAAWAAANDTQRVVVAARYRSALAPYAPARERLAAALRSDAVYEYVLAGAAVLVEQLGDADGAAELRRIADQRYITGLKVGQEAQSFKLGNAQFTFPSALLAAGTTLSTVAAATDPAARPIAIAGAVVLLIATLAQSLVRKIDADDASVFLGLARAVDDTREAALADIVTATNAARNDGPLRLGVLTEEEVHQSLSVLWKTYKSVEPVDSDGKRWRVQEEHGHLQ